MSDLIQESVELQQKPDEISDPFGSRFSMLCLNGSGSISQPTDDAAGGHVHHHHRRPCPSCGRREGGSARKRRSRTLSFADPVTSSHPQPKPKRLFLDQEDNVNGFSKIDLPIPFGPSDSAAAQSHGQPCSFSPLRRSVSDPTEAATFFFSPSFDHKDDSSPPMNSESTKRSCALPPLPLRRTVSDPNPNPTCENISESANKVGRVNKEDSPNSKRLRKMKDRLKEMNQWWNEVIREQEEDHGDATDDNDTMKKLQNECCRKQEGDQEETVGVERVGDSLELHLKCPCGKGFEILLCGRSCFYKLL